MIGAVVMAYGSPESMADIERYYTHIRHGRPPQAAQLTELRGRYEAVGGTAAFAQHTSAQLDALADALGDGWVVRLGQKHSPPFIEDGVAELAAAGVSAIVGVVLAPHFSAASIGEYHSRAAAACGSVPYARIDRWYDLDAYVRFMAGDLRRLLDDSAPNTKVVFTAHSLPERVLVGDPYPSELRAGAGLIAARAGLSQWGDWGLAWQSAGRTPEPWRGPDISMVLRDLAETGRSPGVIVVPHGFTSTNLELRYDLDIAAAATAEDLGLAFARTAVIDDHTDVMAALAERVASSAP